jgi:hypothetical protein
LEGYDSFLKFFDKKGGYCDLGWWNLDHHVQTEDVVENKPRLTVVDGDQVEGL